MKSVKSFSSYGMTKGNKDYTYVPTQLLNLSRSVMLSI